LNARNERELAKNALHLCSVRSVEHISALPVLRAGLFSLHAIAVDQSICKDGSYLIEMEQGVSLA